MSSTAINVLGNDLGPKELGRLLSEVVLAGSAGVDESWAVLIRNVLESASVVIAADDSIQLTARTLLRDILYRSKFKFRNGEEKMEYGIVWRAEKVGRHSKKVNVRIACDRIFGILFRLHRTTSKAICTPDNRAVTW